MFAHCTVQLGKHSSDSECFSPRPELPICAVHGPDDDLLSFRVVEDLSINLLGLQESAQFSIRSEPTLLRFLGASLSLAFGIEFLSWLIRYLVKLAIVKHVA